MVEPSHAPSGAAGDDAWGLDGLLGGEKNTTEMAFSQAVKHAASKDNTHTSNNIEDENDGKGGRGGAIFSGSSPMPSQKIPLDARSAAMQATAMVAPEQQATVKREVVDAPFKPNRRRSKKMVLGKERGTGRELAISPTILARHAAMLGSTGSGKTVMAKALIEEATMAGIPSLIIDPQGDLARLALGVDVQSLRDHGGDLKRRAKFLDMAEVRVWTPLRSKGLPICIDPFVAPPDGLDAEEAITAWDMVAAGFTGLADYDIEKAIGKQVKPYIYEIMVHGTRLNLPVGDFQALAKTVREPHELFTRLLYPMCFIELEEGEERLDVPPWDEVMEQHSLPHFEDMLPKSTRNELARRLSAYSSGVNQLLFSNGVPINFDTFCEPAERGKIPLNILYLNTIQDDAQKQYFVQEIARGLYDWMLTQQPAEGELKLLFFMDEVAPYLPPYPRNPPAKDLIKLIFKQARKYGVACVLATQNVSDVDYKILAQANTTFIGRFTQPQDVEKVKHLLKERGGDQSLVDQLPTLGPGQFQLVSPDVRAEPIPLQCRWLYTDHGTPLSEEQVDELTSQELRQWARTKGRGRSSRGGGGAANIAALGTNGNGYSGDPGLVESALRINSAGGMAAAARGDVSSGAFEVRLMGGLSVLRDGRDPLYLMQGITNAASAATLIWSLGTLMMAWKESEIGGLPLIIGFVITAIVLGIVILEILLSHDMVLQKKLAKYAHKSQYILAAWLWALLLWHNLSPSWSFGSAYWLLEVSVVWVSMFLIIEVVNRFRLGRLHWAEGETALETVKGRIEGVTAILTDAQYTEMRANSKQILAGIRWCLDFTTLIFLAALIYLLFNQPTINEGIIAAQVSVHPAIWLASIYALMFSSETWLRMRGRLPRPSVD
jgi:hypothetical protein